jgi:hypothetical protein
MSHLPALTASVPTPPRPAVAVQQALAILAPDSPQRAAKLSAEELGNELLEPISGVAFLLGHSKQLLDEQGLDLNLLADAVAEMVKHRFPSLTLPEIGLAWRRGASGAYAEPGVLDLVSLPTLARWLERYTAGERKQALALREKETTSWALPPPQRDKAAEVVALVELAHAGQLPASDELDFGNVLYDWLDNLAAFGGFRTREQYEELWVEETENMIRGARPNGGEERRQHAAFLDALGRSEWPAHHPLARSVTNAFKKRVLREWLLDLAAECPDVPALLAHLQNQNTQPSKNAA